MTFRQRKLNPIRSKLLQLNAEEALAINGNHLEASDNFTMLHGSILQTDGHDANILLFDLAPLQ